MPIQIHATKKLAAKLPLDDLGYIATKPVKLRAVPPSDNSNPLSGWHANLITLQRRNCILLVHNQTRFPVFIKCLKKADFVNFDGLFQHNFMNTLLKGEATDEQMQKATQLLDDVCFDTTTDRKVLGTLNRMTGDINHALDFEQINIEDVSEYRLGAWLAQMICGLNKRKDYIIPKKAMFELLDSI